MPIKSMPELFAATTQTTKEALTFPVDYNDGTAVDPAAGQRFSTQAEIDAFLADNSTSNFKHFIAAWESIADNVVHTPTFNLAAGVHRPRNPEANSEAFRLGGKSFANGVGLEVNGASSVSYRTKVASTGITAVGAGIDPYADFSGTPFPGDNSLRGYSLVTSTGQVTVINRHTTSRLYVNRLLTGGPTSGTVMVPGTILRNSYDDITYAKFLTGLTTFFPEFVQVTINDIAIEGFGCIWEFYNQGGAVRFNRCLWDQAGARDDFAVTTTFHAIQAVENVAATHILFDCSFRGTGIAATPVVSSNNALTIQSGVSAQFSYWGGFKNGINQFADGPTFVALSHCFFDECSVSGITLAQSSQLRFSDYSAGKQTTFDGCGISINIPDSGVWIATANSKANFLNSVGACIHVGTKAHLNLALADLVDGGGNGDVGINIAGLNAAVTVGASVLVSGSAGDVRMSDTSILTYANILASGPYTDVGLNLVG